MQQNQHLLSWLYLFIFESRNLTDEDASPQTTPLLYNSIT